MSKLPARLPLAQPDWETLCCAPGSSILIAVTLHHRLATGPAHHYGFGVAFEVMGHYYPFTVSRVSAS